jgi:hypothetical protein
VSTLLLGGSVVLFIVAFLAKIPAAGDVIVLLMFAAVSSRFLFFLALFRSLRASRKPAAKVAAFQCVVWFLVGAAFFKFVVLYQFRDAL